MPVTAIFISHRSTDAAEAAALKRWLSSEGHTELFLDFDPMDGIPAGVDWEQRLYRELRRCQALLVVLTPAWLESKWCSNELAIAREKGKAVFVVRTQPCVGGPLIPSLQEIDLTTERSTGLSKLAKGLKEHGLDPANAFAWNADRPIYPGLSSFDVDDASIFFGREAESLAACEAMRRLRLQPPGSPKLLLITGASGSGKSSLMRVGLLARLRNEPASWIVARPFRRGRDGLNELAAVLASVFPGNRQFPSAEQIRERLLASDSPSQLLALARELRAATNRAGATLVLALDQAEELLASDAGPDAVALLDLVRAALEDSAEELMVVATIRSDRLDAWLQHPSVKAGEGSAGLFFESFPLGPMPMDRLGDIVRKPAAWEGVTIDDDLVDALKQDTATADALPLLAYTLRHLYGLHGADQRLTLHEYRSIGGLEGSIRTQAERVVDIGRLEHATLEAMRDAFVPGLVRATEDGSFVRAPSRLSLLPPTAQPLFRRLCDEARLVVIDRDRDGQETVDIAHEALLRVWPLLSGWLKDDTVRLQQLATVERASLDWISHREHLDFLIHRRDRLLEVEALVTVRRFGDHLSDSVLAYIAACRKAENDGDARERQIAERELRDARELALRRKIQVQGTAVAAALLLLVAAVAVWQWDQAVGARMAADKERAAALSASRSRQLTADVGLARVALADGDRQLALKLAADVAAADPDPPLKREAMQILYAGLLTRLPLKVLDGRLIDARDGKARLFKAEGNTLTIREYSAKSGEISTLASFAGGHAARCTWATCYDDEGIYEIDPPMTHPKLEGMSVLAASPVATEFILGAFPTQAELKEELKNSLELFKVGLTGALKSLGTFSSDPEWDPVGAYWSETGRTVAVVSQGGSKVLGPDSTGVPLETPRDYSPLFAVFSPDDMLIATASSDYPQVRLWDSRTGKFLSELPTGSSHPKDVAFDPRGDTILVGNQSGLVALFSVREKRLVATLGTRSVAVRDVDSDRTGTRLCALWEDGTAMVWDAATLAPAEGPVKPRSGAADRIACEDERLYLSGRDGRTEVWDVSAFFDSAALRVTPIGDPRKEYEFGFDASGAARLTAVDQTSACVKVWVAGGGEVPCSTTAAPAKESSYMSYLGGSSLASGVHVSPDGTVKIDATEFAGGTYERAGLICNAPREAGASECVAKADPDETVVAAQSGHGGPAVSALVTSLARLILFDGSTGALLGTISLPSLASFERLDFIRHDRVAGRLFLFFGVDYVEIWDLETGARFVRVPTAYTVLGMPQMSADVNEEKHTLAAYRDQQIFEYRYFAGTRGVVEAARAALDRQRPE